MNETIENETVKKRKLNPIISVVLLILIGIGSYFALKQIMFWMMLSGERQRVEVPIETPVKPDGIVVESMPDPSAGR